MNKPKRRPWDIETTTDRVELFGLKVDGYISHEQLIDEHWIICGSWKDYKKDKVYSVSVKPRTFWDDYKVVKTLCEMVGESDELIHHYGDYFDLPVLRARALFHGINPFPPVLTTDTKKIASKLFKFNSNKLDYLAQYLKLGKKKKTDYDLWKRCRRGDAEAIKYMTEYNKQDVKLLEAVHDKLAAWAPATLNLALFSDGDSCPNCGSLNIQKRGLSYTKTGTKQRYVCTDCGHWSHGKIETKRGVLR
jgi:DNA polymerase elongation subunit (family B)